MWITYSNRTECEIFCILGERPSGSRVVYGSKSHRLNPLHLESVGCLWNYILPWRRPLCFACPCLAAQRRELSRTYEYIHPGVRRLSLVLKLSKPPRYDWCVVFEKYIETASLWLVHRFKKNISKLPHYDWCIGFQKISKPPHCDWCIGFKKYFETASL